MKNSIFFSYNLKLIHYPSFTKIIKYNNYQRSLLFNNVPRGTSSNSTQSINKSDNIRKSLSRSKNKVKNYILCNNFKYFFTLTFDKSKIDRYDKELIFNYVQNWFKNQSRKYSNFKYLYVCELHSDNALHFHGVCTDINVRNSVNLKTNEIIKTSKGLPVYNLVGFTKGFTSATKIQDNIKCASYIIKYITKNCFTIHNHRYFCSRNLDEPTIELKSYNGLKFSHLDFFQPDYQDNFKKIFTLRK